MERIVPNKIAYGERLANAGYFNEALAVYFELAKYPIIRTEEINALIGSTYRGQAELYLDQENYLEADRFLRIALQYIPEQRPQIEERLRQIVDLFIKKGDAFLAQRDFDNALTHYQRVFEIIPDYPPRPAGYRKSQNHPGEYRPGRSAFQTGRAHRSQWKSGRRPQALSTGQRPGQQSRDPDPHLHNAKHY
jgi:tetratricopeptide (TPR) repeat protein